MQYIIEQQLSSKEHLKYLR